VALDTSHIVGRLFDEIAAEYFDFTITVQDRELADRWLQLRGNSINLPYPHDGKPEEVLSDLDFNDIFGGVEWHVDDWTADSSVTVDWGPLGHPTDHAAERDVLAAIVKRLLEKYLGLPADSERWVVSEQ
jgi:hypothetical protein